MESRVIKYTIRQSIDFYRSYFGVKDQLPRFLVVGLLGIGVDLLVFSLVFHVFAADIFAAQVISFVAAVTHNFTLNRYWTFKQRNTKEASRKYLKFFLVACFALGLRSGVIANCVALELSPFVSLLAGIGSGTAVNFIGSREWAFAERTSPRLASGFLLWTFITFLFVIRLVYGAIVELSPEEAYYWNYAMHPSLSYFDHPPMVAWIIRLGTILFGNTEIGVRSGGILLAMLSTYLIYLLGERWFDKRSGLIAALLFQTIPIYFVYGFNVTPDIPLLFFWIMTLYYVSVALQATKRWAWFIAGISLGCALLSKYTGVFLIPSTVLFLLLNGRYREWLLKKEPYIALAIALVVFSPVIVWNYYHGWASFAFQFGRRFSVHAADPLVTFLKFLGSQMGVLFPVFFLGLVLAFVLSFRQSIRGGKPQWLFSFLYAFPLLVLFTLYSFKSEVKLNWPLPAYLSLLGAVYPCFRYVRRGRKGRLKALIPTAAAVSTGLVPVFLLIFLYHMSVGIPFIPAVPKMSGWEQLGAAVDREVAAMAKETGEHPFVVGMSKYYIAAELAFYTNRSYDIFSMDLLGGKGLAFKYWTNREELRNRDALVITKGLPNIHLLANYFLQVSEEVKRIDIVRQGEIIRSFSLVRCYDYKV